MSSPTTPGYAIPVPGRRRMAHPVVLGALVVTAVLVAATTGLRG